MTLTSPGEIVRTPEFTEAITRLHRGDSLFLTGKAGTGKSTLIRALRQVERFLDEPAGFDAVVYRNQPLAAADTHAVRILRDGFEWALRNSALTHFDANVRADHDSWYSGPAAPVRIPWDPERDIGTDRCRWGCQDRQ